MTRTLALGLGLAAAFALSLAVASAAPGKGKPGSGGPFVNYPLGETTGTTCPGDSACSNIARNRRWLRAIRKPCAW